MTKLNSSQLAEAGWENETLEILFCSGGRYRYQHVPENLFTGLIDAPSPGKFFAKEIKSNPGKYPFTKVQ